MRRIIAVLPLALFVGCAARVSVTGTPPFTVVKLWGSHRALEREAAELRSQLTGAWEKDKVIRQKIEAIRESLTHHGYLVQRDFMLPHVHSRQTSRKEVHKKIARFGPKDRSPLAVVFVDPMNWSLVHGPPIRITVIDRKTNLPEWKRSLEAIDKEPTVDSRLADVSSRPPGTANVTLKTGKHITGSLSYAADYIMLTHGPDLCECGSQH
ncbi:hypothetical protein ACFLQU_05005 [Verrucomicrobiota bacterium]